MKQDKENLLNKDNILSKISKQDILQYYLPGAIPGKAMNSVFRVDDSASLYISKNGDHYKDLGDSRYEGDSFRSVMQLYNVEFFDALKIINRDFQLGLDGETVGDYKKIVKELPKPKKKPPTIFEVTNRELTSKEMEWWKRHLQTPESLKADFVYGKGLTLINGKEAYSNEGEMAFHYNFPEIGKHKIYHPERDKKNGKWLSNVPIYYVEGREDVRHHHKILITKARKCRMVLKALGIPTCNVQNESDGAFTPEFISFLEGKEVWILFDGDETGIKQGKYVSEKHGYNQLILPKKDVSEWVYNDGPKDPIEFFYQNKFI